MKQQPWVPPPCKTTYRPTKTSSSKRRSKKLFHRQNSADFRRNGGKFVEKCDGCKQYFERPIFFSDYFEILNNLSSFKLLYYQAKDEIQDVNSKLNEKLKDISQLQQDLEAEKVLRQKSERNLEILSNLIEKYETLNNVQHEKIIELESKLNQNKESPNLVDSISSPLLPDEELEKPKVSSKSTQIDSISTRIQSIQTNFVSETAENSNHTDSEEIQKARHVDRSVQTNDNFTKEFDENKKKIKLLKAKLKSYKEKSTIVRDSSSSAESSSAETLKTLQQNFIRLKLENQKLKECLKFLKDSFRILYVDG